MELNDRAATRLREDKILWLTTVGEEGQPQSSPVWFLWDGEKQLLVYSLDDTPRVDNLDWNRSVAANLNSDGGGGSIVTMEGTARIDRDFPPAKDVEQYIEKYQELLDSYGWTAEYFSTDYSVPILISIDRIRASS
jgi:PPOX class probable F420-dependent enzyme